MSRKDIQQIVFEEHEKTQPTTAADEGGPARQFSLDTQDIVAIGALVLCIGAVCVAVTVALGFAFGKTDGNPATNPLGVVSAERQSVGCKRRSSEEESGKRSNPSMLFGTSPLRRLRFLNYFSCGRSGARLIEVGAECAGRYEKIEWT